MKTFTSIATTLGLCVIAVIGISPADAATSSKALTVSAVVTTTCKLIQDHDNLSAVTSLCTNGADFSAAPFGQATPFIQRADSGPVVTF